MHFSCFSGMCKQLGSCTSFLLLPMVQTENKSRFCWHPMVRCLQCALFGNRTSSSAHGSIWRHIGATLISFWHRTWWLWTWDLCRLGSIYNFSIMFWQSEAIMILWRLCSFAKATPHRTAMLTCHFNFHERRCRFYSISLIAVPFGTYEIFLFPVFSCENPIHFLWNSYVPRGPTRARSQLCDSIYYFHYHYFHCYLKFLSDLQD